MRLICGLVILFAVVIGNVERAWGDACSDQRASIASNLSSCLSFPLPGCGDGSPGSPNGPSAVRPVYLSDGSGGVYVYCQLQYCPDWGSLIDIGDLSKDCHPNLTTSGLSTTIAKPINACGSIIQTTNQVVGESIPIIGAPFELTYFSNRVVGRIADYESQSIITGATVPSTATSYTLTIKNEVGTTVYSSSYGTSANQTYTYTWNGLDASSVETWGPLNYSFDMKENASDFSPELITTVRVGNLKAKKLGLGGWVPSIWHYYNIATKTLFKGDGSFRNADYDVDGSYYRVPEEDSSLVYYFNSNGTIAYTKLGLTGTTIYTFSYDGYGHLSTIVEPFSRTTTFNYSSGVLTSIVAPNGKTTTASLDGNGYLHTLTNPKSEIYTMTYYSTDGLLYTFTKPNGAVSTMVYDGVGNLVSDSNSGGSSVSLSKTDSTVTSTSAEGRISTNTLNSGGTETLAKPSGYTMSVYSVDSAYAVYRPENTLYDTYSDDPRFGSKAHVTTDHIFNNFGNRDTQLAYNVTLGSADPFSITTYQTVADVGSSEITSTYTGSTKTNITSTKLGRTHTSVIDAYQRLTSDQQGSLTATAFTYTNELLTQIAQGARTTTLAYNGTTKLLASITDALSHVTSYAYDNAERLTSKTLPDLRVINYTYDSEGNLATITPPSRPVHTFNFGANEMVSSYVPPSLTGVTSVTTSYTHNNDHQLTQTTRPDGTVISYNYDATSGLMTSITGSFGTIAETYINEKPYSRTDQNGNMENYNYSGITPNYIQFYDSSYTAGYTFSRSPDSTAGEKIGQEIINDIGSGTQTINYTYDDDEFLTGIGDLTLSYNTPNGQLTGTVIGNVNDAYTYNSFGEVTGYTAKYNTTTIYSYTLTRDDLGRVTQKVETLNGVTTTFDYTYDVAGRLTQVKKNTVMDSTYSYDDNSNRTGGSIHGSSTSGTYNNQDWMTAFNANTYTYNANGETLTRYNSTTGVTTTFTWDPFGNVQSVQVGSTTYNYGLTPSYHRYEKSVGGTVQNIYAYNPEGRLIGELDSSSALKKTFVYGTKSNVPDYYIDDASNEFRIISDQIGSVRLVVNVATGTVVQLMEHDEFGRVLQDTSPGLQPFGFAGGLYDKDTGYVLFGARSYDPESGRWLSKDPILFAGGDTNLMSYVSEDPVNWIDPSGLVGLRIPNIPRPPLPQQSIPLNPEGGSVKPPAPPYQPPSQPDNGGIIDGLRRMFNGPNVSPNPGGTRGCYENGNTFK